MYTCSTNHFCLSHAAGSSDSIASNYHGAHLSAHCHIRCRFNAPNNDLWLRHNLLRSKQWLTPEAVVAALPRVVAGGRVVRRCHCMGCCTQGSWGSRVAIESGFPMIRICSTPTASNSLTTMYILTIYLTMRIF